MSHVSDNHRYIYKHTHTQTHTHACTADQGALSILYI